MTSDNVTEAESVEAAEPQLAKRLDDQLINELVGRAARQYPQPLWIHCSFDRPLAGLASSAPGA